MRSHRWITYWFILSFLNDFATSGHIVCVQDHQPSESVLLIVLLFVHVSCVVFVFIAGSHWIPPPFKKTNKQTNKQTINWLSDAIAIFLLEDSTKKENGSWPLYYFFSPKRFIYNSSLLTVAVGGQTSQSNGFRSKNIHVEALRKTLLERRLIFLWFEGNMMVVE